MLAGCYQKNKKRLVKGIAITSLVKDIVIFPKNKKTRNINMLVNNREIFFKKRKTKNANIVANDMKTSQNMKSKG